MPKFDFVNDTNREMSIHSATVEQGVKCCMIPIPPKGIRTFVLPEGTYPLVTIQDNDQIFVMVREEDETDE